MGDSGHQSQNHNTAEEQVIMKEMLPYFIFAALPIFLTIILAYVFGPSM